MVGKVFVNVLLLLWVFEGLVVEKGGVYMVEGLWVLVVKCFVLCLDFVVYGK